MCRNDITFAVTDQKRIFKIDMMFLGRFGEHPGFGFPAAARTGNIRMMRAVIDAGYSHTLLLKPFKHPLCQGFKIFFGVITPSDAGLVGHDDDHVTKCLIFMAQFKNAVNKLEIFGSVQIVLFNIHHAVTIEKKCRSGH